MWTAAESDAACAAAREAAPRVVTHAIPFGLQVREGPDAVVAHLVDVVPRLLA